MDRPVAGRDDDAVAAEKSARRAEFRRIRRAVTDVGERSARIWGHLEQIAAYRGADRVLMFASIPGEPDTTEWIATARAGGKGVWVPEDAELPDTIDLVIVPGLAFDVRGGRLGQGGGWYDRYLAVVAERSIVVGVCFDCQLVDRLPTQAHDVAMDLIVSESGPTEPRSRATTRRRSTRAPGG